MTVILGAVDGGKCFLGSDAGVWGGSYFSGRLTPGFKAWKAQCGAVVGCAGSADMLAQFHAETRQAMWDELPSIFEQCYVDADEDENKEQALDCLVGVGGDFMWLTKNGYTIPLLDTITSLGQSDVAEGALRALLLHTEMSVPVAMNTALGIQSRQGSYCEGPFSIIREG